MDGDALTAATISVDLTGITSNDSRRNNAIQQALATSRYPAATFVLTTPVGIESVPTDGQRVDISATGDLTIHGITRPVLIPLQAQLQNGVLVVVGTTEVSFADYGVTAPTAPLVASVETTPPSSFSCTSPRTDQPQRLPPEGRDTGRRCAHLPSS